MTRYEFALLRYVHEPASGEVANVGVVMYDVAARRLLVRTTERYRRLSNFFGQIDGPSYHAMVRQVERAFVEIEEGLRQPDLMTPGPQTLDEALQLALPDPDSCFTASRVMYGVHDNPEHRFYELYHEFVARFDTFAERDRRDAEDIRRDFTNKVNRATDLRARVQLGYELAGPNYSHKFAAGWRNGKTQVLDGISFDILDASRIVEKANLWTGRLVNLTRGADFLFTGVVAPPPPEPPLQRAFEQAMTILKQAPSTRKFVLESEADVALQLIREDVADLDDESPYRR